MERVRLERWPHDDPGGRRPRYGSRRPRAIAWFGFTAFWGHLRHLVASMIATESIDSRQWMMPEAPDALLARVVEVLAPRARRPSDEPAETLADALGGEVWIDFVADTGDDVTVSEAVARLVTAEYDVDDPDREGETLVLPRGHVLFHGGDLAYPVATVLEMTRRLLEPWNRVLDERSDGKPRVLLGVPGNHDWYDGLDGFARLFQAPCAFEDVMPASSDPHHPRPSIHPVLAWAEAFARGDAVKKPRALALSGYEPVQRTSYFRLALAKGIDLFAVDRQLRRVDDRQSAYFAVPGAPARLVVVPDPARAWGETQENGQATLEAIGVDPKTSPTLIVAGDIHHYERSREGKSIHVVAGGGGAFLHAARVAGSPEYATEREFPGPRASARLLRALPVVCASGHAGWLLVSILGVADAFALLAQFREGWRGSLGVALAVSLVVAIGTALLVGWRRHRHVWVVAFAATIGLGIGALPVALGVVADHAAFRVIRSWGPHALARPIAFLAALGLATFVSAFFFGGMLMLIARLGLNHAQPYAALGSPGYKHFMRLRVRAEGVIDAWVVGAVDPVRSGAPVLVDAFRFDPYERRARGA